MLIAVTGCSVAPLPALKPPTPEAWRNAPSPLLPLKPDLTQWWHAFNDPELDTLVDRALQNNLDVAAAVERLRATRVLTQHSQSPYLPSLAIKTHDAISPDTSTSYFLIGFDSQWELPLFGAKQSADRLAQGNEALVQADLRSIQVSLVAEVTRHWIELRSAQQAERALTAIRDTQREKLQLLRVREQLALAPHSDVVGAQAELARAEMMLTGPRQLINRNAQQLALLSGKPEPDALWLRPGPQPTLGQWQLNRVPADLLRTRPEIASAEAEVLMAAGELGMSRADMYPHLSLGASLQWSLNIASNRKHTPSGNSIFSAGPGINIPLLDWGQRAASAQAKDHQMQAAVLAYRQAVLQGVAEAEIAMGDLEQTRLREQASRQVYTETQTRLEALQQRASLGLMSTLDLATARVEELHAKQQADSASTERGIAYIALYKALGGAPLPAPTLKDAD
ncbi:efflux transporter, outer membrane factor (OMF) lipoprotein, NodT family [Pseudomonas costantinii]|uniref:Efflux transporter, outer membrane factor (OMF) lipoprotein, NodT family n=1 Tax=Pseudomonas costantinii TaxID=168469 RepID=A0A1H5H017_9PSED|nr:efflux transporter, outer membrane factor (OMF) lipoprotein, NodT family [Pseudomonas costantinii]